MTSYFLLFGVQALGASVVIWNLVASFEELLPKLGEQVQNISSDSLTTFGALCSMQGAYWYRLLRVPVAVQRPNAILNHTFLFLGRLSFVFGSTFFSVVFFRHLPNLDLHGDIWLVARRGTLFGLVLFSLFCFSLELERLGAALGQDHRNSLRCS